MGFLTRRNMLGVFVLPVLAFSKPSDSSKRVVVEIQPIQNLLWPSRSDTQTAYSQMNTDFRVQSAIGAIRFTSDAECLRPELHVQGHYSARDVQFQHCQEGVALEMHGFYSVRDGNTNEFIHHDTIKGLASFSNRFARKHGDMDLLPKEKRDFPEFSDLPNYQELFHVSWVEFWSELERSIRSYFAQTGLNVTIIHVQSSVEYPDLHEAHEQLESSDLIIAHRK